MPAVLAGSCMASTLKACPKHPEWACGECVLLQPTIQRPARRRMHAAMPNDIQPQQTDSDSLKDPKQVRWPGAT